MWKFFILLLIHIENVPYCEAVGIPGDYSFGLNPEEPCKEIATLRKQKQNCLVRFQPRELQRIILSATQFYFIAGNKTCNSTFFETFSRILLLSDWNGDKPEDLRFLSEVLTSVANFNQMGSNKSHFQPLQIWVAIIPETKLPTAVKSTLDLIHNCNKIFSGTVTTFLLNYRLLHLDQTSAYLVQDDIKYVKLQIFHHPLKTVQFGVVFNSQNCFAKNNFIFGLNITTGNQIVFTSLANTENYIYLMEYIDALRDCVNTYKDVTANVAGDVLLQIEFDDEISSFTFDVSYLVNQAARNELSRPLGYMLLTAVFKDVSGNDSLPMFTTKWIPEQSWLTTPTQFSKTNFGVVVSYRDVDEFTSHDIYEMAKTFPKIVIDSGSGNQDDDMLLKLLRHMVTQDRSLAKTHKELPDVSLIANINSLDHETIKASVTSAFMAADITNLYYPGTVNTVWLNWMSCKHDIRCPRPNYHVPYTFKDDVRREADEPKLKTSTKVVKEIRHLNTKEKNPYFTGIHIFFGIIFEASYCSQSFQYYTRDVDYGIAIKYADKIIVKFILKKQDILAHGVLKSLLIVTTDLMLCESALREDGDLNVPQFTVFIKLIGCNDDAYSTWTELALIVKFFELLNSWAVKENRAVIMDAAFQRENNLAKDVTSCHLKAQSMSSTGDCDCGWWTKTTNSSTGKDKLLLLDRKSIAYNMMEKLSEQPPFAKEQLKTWAEDNLVFIIAAILVVTTIVMIIFTICVLRRLKSKSLLSNKQMKHFFNGSHILHNKRENNFELCDWENSQSEPYNRLRYELSSSKYKIDWEQCLGSGEFGQVFYAQLKSGRSSTCNLEVAVKMTNINNKADSHDAYLALRALIYEVKMLSYIGEHNHIIKLEGANTRRLRQNELFVFLEFCQLGSLHDHLRAYRAIKTTLSPNDHESIKYENVTDLSAEMSLDLNRWAGEIASGMEFMASKKVVHGDLATGNILLTKLKCAKISDFGSSRRLYDYPEYLKGENGPLPWKWMAPESLRRMVFTEKSDVWAFGITLWEMYSLGDEPYPGLSWDPNFPTCLERGLRPAKLIYNELGMYSIMKQCWSAIACERPNFGDLKKLVSRKTPTEH